MTRVRTDPSGDRGAAAPSPDEMAEVLGRAKSLVNGGRRDDAIELLHEYNRRARQPKVARRLLRLRHDAFEDADRSTAWPDWPRSLPDPFPGVVGPPEIGPADLTGAVLGGAMVNHGCLLVRGLVDPTTTARLIDDVDRALEAAQQWMDGAPPASTAPWFEIFKPNPPYSVGMSRKFVVNGGGVLAADSPPAFFDVVDMLTASGLRPVLTEYLGERPALSAKKTTLRRVPVDSGSDWHQDGAFLGRGIRTVNVWVALTACGQDAPGIDVVPRRLPLVDTGTEGAVFDWSVGRPVVERAAGAAGIVRPRFEAGDAMLFDDLFLHSTAVGPGMTETRYAIEAWCFAPSAYPHDQVPILF